MKYQTFDIFPTQVIRVDVSKTITEDDINTMIVNIDTMCEEKKDLNPVEDAPKYQSKPMLFREGSPQVWKKLQQTFHESCGVYLNSLEDFCKYQKSLQIAGSVAWFYKSWNSLNKDQTNPWHDHTPAFLSGVFYVKVPNSDATEGGTEFMDPRKVEANYARRVHIHPMEMTWLIFPSWLNHRSNRCKSEDPRYVIAADLYVVLP
jgi:hypothetical protein